MGIHDAVHFDYIRICFSTGDWGRSCWASSRGGTAAATFCRLSGFTLVCFTLFPLDACRSGSAAVRTTSWSRRLATTPRTSSLTPTSSPSAPASPSTTTTPLTSSRPPRRSSASALAARSAAASPTSLSASAATSPFAAASTVPSCTTPARPAWTWASSTRPRCARTWE